LWGQRFSRNLSDILAVQTEISNQIADQLKVRLSGEERKQLNKQSTVNSEAYQFYLQGRYQWNKRSREGFMKAIDYFNQAIEKDPVYARAYAGLADCYVTDSSPFPMDVRIPRGKSAALKAIQLDPSLGEAETSLAGVYSMEWDWEAASQAFRRAIQLNPNYPTAHQWYAEYLVQLGKKEEAIQEMKKALQLDPLSLIINTTTSYVYFLSRDYQKAEEYARKALDLDPHFQLAQDGLLQTLQQQHKYQEIFQYFEKSNPDEQTRKVLEDVKQAYQKEGEHGLLEFVLKMKLAGGSDAFDLAIAYAQLNEKEKACEYLEKSFQSRDSQVALINVDPVFDNIRTDPRFQELVRRLNLPK
jgi:Tfp pilus assembly protein PilF